MVRCHIYATGIKLKFLTLAASLAAAPAAAVAAILFHQY